MKVVAFYIYAEAVKLVSKLLPYSSEQGFPLYEYTADGRAATHQLYSFAIEFGLAPMHGTHLNPVSQTFLDAIEA